MTVEGVYEWDGEGEVHIVPVDDLIVHTEHRHCWCVPRVEYVGPGTIIVHNSADGREEFELPAVPPMRES